MPTIEGSAVDVLENARKLIERPEYWVQGAMARDNEGNDINTGSWSACGYCAAVAVAVSVSALTGGGFYRSEYNLATTNKLYMDADKLLVEVLMRDPDNIDSLTVFNEHPLTTHQKVMDLFDEAIELARGNL